MTSKWVGIGLVMGTVCLNAAACSHGASPSNPSATALDRIALDGDSAGAHVHASSQPDDKGYLNGWFEGSDVQLYYTKSYYCAEPPLSGADSNCEIGAPPEAPPRPGRIPTIYAIAAAGFEPPSGTVACPRGTPAMPACLDHPSMIDLSLIGGPTSGRPVPHSHILSAHGAGWFNTVNIRVFSSAAWNEIAAAKSLVKVRELQGNNPQVGTPGVISADTPTNIYFFIASWRNN